MNPIASFLKYFNWHIAVNSLFARLILQGVIITISLAVVSQLAGTLIGLALYFLRRSRFVPFRWLAEAYIWFFRGTPLLVQILFAYNALPYLGLSNPLRNLDIFTQLGFVSIYTDAMLAGLVALSLNEGAYMAEIVRAGIDSIDIGQMEAAKSLGMTYAQGMRRIVLPQAMRVIIPPLGNEFNNMLKTTSLVYVIGVYDLLGAAKAIGDFSFRTLELLVTASIWYLAMTTVWGFVQAYIERKFNAANIDPALREGSWWRRMLGIRGRPAPAPALAGGALFAPGVEPPSIQGDRR